nr:hypothetical protein [Tanacetum cinerariifolium]
MHTERARDAGFLWERVVEVMGSSGGSGEVVRSREEVVAGLAGKKGCVQCLFKRGGEDRVSFRVLHNWSLWLAGTKKVSPYGFKDFEIWQD